MAHIGSNRLNFVSLSHDFGSNWLIVSKISGNVSVPHIEKHGDPSKESLRPEFGKTEVKPITVLSNGFDLVSRITA